MWGTSLITVLLFCASRRTRAESHSAYPASYPVAASVQEVIDSLPISTPDFSLGPNDPGGYVLLVQAFDVNDYSEVFPNFALYDVTQNTGFSNMWTNGIGPIPEEYSIGNCTVFSDMAAYARIPWRGKAQCEGVADCCPGMHGVPMLKQTYANQMFKLSNVFDAMLCPDFSDVLTIILCIDTHRTSNYCFGQFVSVNERYVILPCYDIYYMHMLECKAYSMDKSAMGELDSELYVKDLSQTQISVLFGTFRTPDRVCHPWSYYNPAADVGGDGGSDGGNDGGNVGGNDDSSAANVLALFATFLVMLML